MLVVMNTNATEKDIQRVILYIESKGFEARVCHGETKSVVHAIGIQEADKRDLQLLNGVFEVLKISTNYRLTSRSFQHSDTIVEINGIKFFIVSGAYPSFYSEDKQFFVRGELKAEDYRRIKVSFSEYLIIFELVKKYNEKFS